jgi:molecular chaperone DnaK
VARRLFSDDVPTDKLALSVRIETQGGASSIMIPRNAPLPTTHTEVFTTSADNQTSLEVHVVQGERAMAADNRSLGKFQLVNIPPAAAGVPQIKVTFAIDGKGVLEVNALDLTSNTYKRLKIEGGLLGSRFDQSDVAKALAAESVATKAQESAEAWVFGRAKLEEMTVATLKAFDDNAAYMSQDVQRETTEAIKKARAFLDANPNKDNGDVAAVQAATRDLMKAAMAAQAELAKSGR